MAAAAVKLPLAVKKALKDKDAVYKAELAGIQAAVGFPVTFNWNVESVYTATEGHGSRDDIASVAESYIKALRRAIERECKDAMVKETLVSQWTTKNITLTVEPESFVGADYVKTHIATWGGYNGIRFVNGDLDIFTKKDRYWSNDDQLANANFVELFQNVKGDLPLSMRKELRDLAPKLKAVTDRIAKALGVDAVKCDWEGDAKAIMPRQEKLNSERGYPYSIELGLNYVESLAKCLEEQAKDDMVKEAIVDAFPAKTISFKVYDNMEGLKGLETHTSYNGIQFLDGQINVFTQQKNFASNIDQVAYEHKLVNLF